MEIRHLDFYCERLGPEFWAEPLNAWSNLGFVIVGIWALIKSLKMKNHHPHAGLLIMLSSLLITVGVGSFLFHTFADNRTQLMDLIPIFLFTMVYMFHSFKNYLSKSVFLATVILSSVVVAMAFVEITVPKTILNGSLLYVPPLVALVGVSFGLQKRHSSWAKAYWATTGVFALALVLRTVDHMICEFFPFGTHFLWHLCNSVFLGGLMRIAFEFRQTNSEV